MATIVLSVTGMKCGGCEKSVQEAVQALAGIESVTASHKASTVEVAYDADQIAVDAIKKTIQGKGFAVA
ncbi:heavy-metal-associated domain-containing protein [Methylomagnum sp.]